MSVQKSRWALVVLSAVLLAGILSCGAPRVKDITTETKGDTTSGTIQSTTNDIQLVQSIPAESHLEQSDLAYTQDTWIAMIRSAKTSIDSGQYYISSEPGHSVDTVLTELEAAAARGVKIRMILSQNMISNDPAALARLQAIPGILVQSWDLSKLTGGIIHAKYWVVDREDVYVGSANFDWRALEHIHELGVRLHDKVIADQLSRIFETDLQIAQTGVAPTPPTPAIVTGVPDAELVASPSQFNPADVRDSLPELLKLIKSATKTLHIQVMSYSLTDIDTALRSAAARGVKVQLMVADWSTGKSKIGILKSLSQVPGVELKIVSIPEFSGGFIPFSRVIHSKYMVVDGSILWVGTSNWDSGYFDNSRNVELILRRTDLAEKGELIFGKLWNSTFAEPIDINKTYVPPRRS